MNSATVTGCNELWSKAGLARHLVQVLVWKSWICYVELALTLTVTLVSEMKQTLLFQFILVLSQIRRSGENNSLNMIPVVEINKAGKIGKKPCPSSLAFKDCVKTAVTTSGWLAAISPKIIKASTKIIFDLVEIVPLRLNSWQALYFAFQTAMQDRRWWC